MFHKRFGYFDDFLSVWLINVSKFSAFESVKIFEDLELSKHRRQHFRILMVVPTLYPWNFHSLQSYLQSRFHFPHLKWLTSCYPWLEFICSFITWPRRIAFNFESLDINFSSLLSLYLRNVKFSSTILKISFFFKCYYFVFQIEDYRFFNQFLQKKKLMKILFFFTFLVS